jgi:serine/threonine protein kinase
MFRRGGGAGGGGSARSPLAHRNERHDDDYNDNENNNANASSSRGLHLFRNKFGTTTTTTNNNNAMMMTGKENDDENHQRWQRRQGGGGEKPAASEDVKVVERQRGGGGASSSSRKREKHGTVCPDVIKEYRETTSARSLTENEIQINEKEETTTRTTRTTTTTSLKNSYKKMKLLGKGGFAVVYSVKDLKHAKAGSAKGGGGEGQQQQQYYAAKVVSKKNLERQKQKDKMLAEIRIHRAAEHEFIVKFTKCFEDDLNVYILMEKCSDRTLADVIKYRGAITETETSAYVWEISQAMQYLHEKLVVHRDLKLGNVFLTDYGLKEASAMADESEGVLRRFRTGEERLKAFERMERSFLLGASSSSSGISGSGISNGVNNSGRSSVASVAAEAAALAALAHRQPRIKIGDFGLAVQLAHKREKKFTVCGTPNYIAPEVLAGSQGPGHNAASDIWSLGVIIYALLCGEPPFQTESVEATYNRIRKTDFRFPDDRQCLKVLSSEHLLNVTTKNSESNKNSNKNNDEERNSENSGDNNSANENVNLPKYRFPISATSRDLVKRCLLAEAEKRLTGVEILEHPFFDAVWAAARKNQTISSTATTENYDEINRNVVLADATTTATTMTPRRASSAPLVSSSSKATLESISLRQMEAETKHALLQHQHALSGQKSWARRARSAAMGATSTTATTTTSNGGENIESARVALAQISVNAGAQTTATSPPVTTSTSFARANDHGLSSSAHNNIPLSARIKVKHFTNQTEQWGLGYALTDNSFGAIFNDESRAVLTKCGTCVFYWPNVATTSTHGGSAEKRLSPRKKFSSKKCIAVPLRQAQNGNAGDNQFNRDLAKKTAILLRFKEILLRKEEEISGGGGDDDDDDDDYKGEEMNEARGNRRKKSLLENLDPRDPNYYYDKNPLFDISKSISLLLDRGGMINYWRTGRSNATTFTFNDGSFQTLFGDANSTSVFCCDDYSLNHHGGGVVLGGGFTKRRLAVCEQRKIPLKNLSKVPVSNTSRLSSSSSSTPSPPPPSSRAGAKSSSSTVRAKVLDAREILSKSARSDTNLEKCVRYCHESGTRLERNYENNNNV